MLIQLKEKDRGLSSSNVWCACTYEVYCRQDGGDIWKTELKFKLHLAIKGRHLGIAKWVHEKQNSLEESWNLELRSWGGKHCMLMLCVSQFELLAVDNALRLLQPALSSRFFDILHSALGPSVGCRLVFVYTWSGEGCVFKTS